MKSLLYIFSACFLVLLGACNESQTTNQGISETNDSQEEKNTDPEEKENEEEKHSEEENMFSLGEFDVVNSKTEVGTVTSGPIAVDILGVSVQNGEINDTYTENLPDGEVTFLRLDFTVISEQDNLTFDREFLPIKVNGEGDWIEPSLRMSGNLSFGYRGAGEYRAYASYLLDKTDADEIKSLTFQVKAPRDENNDPLGEDKSLSIDLTQ